ncbi:MAG TPA: class I SAM-dependent methyltransferase, partial [bacterium]
MPTSPTQAMQPHGWRGVLIGWVMERLNAPVNRAVLERLALRGHETVLEIGFGPGALAKAMLRALPTGRVAGVDPSALMVAKARRANRR